MAAQHRRLRLRDDPNITQYVVDGRATGNKLGIGSYGSVEEVRTVYSYYSGHGTINDSCAGILLKTGDRSTVSEG